MRFFRTLALSVFPLVAFGQTADVDWRFAQPGATLVGGMRIDALLQSPILNTILEQATAKDPTVTAMVGMMRGALGGISEVRFSVLDTGAGREPEVLTLVTGRLDDAAAKALTQGKATVHRVDANTLLLGDGPPVAEAIRRLSKPQVDTHNRAMLRAKALADYDFWIAGALPAMPMTSALTDMLKGLALGFSVRDDLRLELALDTASAATAQDLIRQVREAQRNQPGAESLVAEVDGTTARFRVSVEKAVVLKAIQDQVASGAFASQAGALFGAKPGTTPGVQPTAFSPGPAPKLTPKEPERKTIMIYGLDEGTREIDPNKH